METIAQEAKSRPDNKSEVILLAYKQLRALFKEELSDMNWIWIDYFADEKAGFEYFKGSVESDKDFRYLNELPIVTNIESCAEDLACDIRSKLMKSNVFHELCQACR